jgi:hypothetical protein
MMSVNAVPLDAAWLLLGSAAAGTAPMNSVSAAGSNKKANDKNGRRELIPFKRADRDTRRFLLIK